MTARASFLTAFLLSIVLVAGCSSSGDFGAFFIAQVTKYGGHVKTAGAVPKREARWVVKHDANGFTAQVSGAPFSAVDGFMKETFGAPKISTDANLDGDPQRVWGAMEIGVAIQVIGHKSSIEMICVRGEQNLRWSGGDVHEQAH